MLTRLYDVGRKVGQVFRGRSNFKVLLFYEVAFQCYTQTVLSTCQTAREKVSALNYFNSAKV